MTAVLGFFICLTNVGICSAICLSFGCLNFWNCTHIRLSRASAKGENYIVIMFSINNHQLFVSYHLCRHSVNSDVSFYYFLSITCHTFRVLLTYFCNFLFYFFGRTLIISFYGSALKSRWRLSDSPFQFGAPKIDEGVVPPSKMSPITIFPLM